MPPMTPYPKRKPVFRAIAAMAENRVIGNHGTIPWYLPDDFKWFKRRTLKNVVILGRKTFDSIGKPLPGRENWVLSRSLDFRPQFNDTTPVVSVKELERMAERRARRQPEIEFWVCGGGEIYELLLPRCQDLFLTVVKGSFPGDAYFPEIDHRFDLIDVVENHNLFSIFHYRNKRVEFLEELSHSKEVRNSKFFCSDTLLGWPSGAL